MALPLTRDVRVPEAGDSYPDAAAEAEFRVGVLHEAGAVRVRPIGEVDLATIGHLRERTNEAIASGAARLILDLRATTFLDSTGLHLAIELDRRATRDGFEFLIIAGPRPVRRAFGAVGLSTRLPFVGGTHQPSGRARVVDRRRRRGGRP